MAREPELSIKVKVDPVIDSEKLENDVQNQVKNIKKLPPVPIEPDASGFKEAIEENIGGPYPVEITPTLTKNLTQQVNDEITAAQNGAQQLKVKLDVKEFGNDLSKQLKEQLRGVNRTLSNYLKEMQVNLALANKATYGLFSGGNRNVPVDSIFDEISKKDVKAVQTLTSQLDKVFEGLPKLKSAGKIDFENEIGSVEEFSSALSKMGTALQNMQAALNIYDQKQAKAAYSSAFDEFKKNYINVQGISDVLNGIVNNSSALKNLDIKGSAQLKNFLVSLTDGITAVSSVKDIDVNNFDNLISVLDPDKFGELATNISEVTSQISISTGESKKKLEELKKAEEEAMGAGVPIDPSILDANTKKIIESIGNVSAAMTELETKSKNFSDNLTVEVDKNVSNIESRIKQLTGLVEFLPNGEKNLLEGEKPKNKPAKPKKQNVDPGSKPEDKPENDSNGSTATVNKITFDVDIDELQKAVDVLFAKISAPIGFKPADGAIAAVKKTLEESLNGVEILNAIASKQTDNKDTDNSAQSIPVKGHITITDADVVVDVKNPVAIPGTVTVDPTSVQFGNSDDLQKNASALSSVKQSLKGISTSAEDYGTKIAAIGPSVQYVAQEVDNLSKSLENQITDLDLVAKKTDAYGTTANSITLNAKDVAVAGDPVSIPVKATLEKTAITVPKEAVDIKVKGVLAPEDVKQAETVAPQKPTEVPGHVTLSTDDVVVPTTPVDIPGKVTLKVEDVTPPKGSVKIPGKVELEVSDVTPPKTAVELEGKVSNVTVDDSAKGKKKNTKDDVKKPDVVDLKGKVELKDEDIKRPDPLKLNGSVKIKAADVKIDDVEISKKEFDIKGNLILKNAEIASVIKEVVKKSKDTTPEKVTSQDISEDNKAVNIEPIEQNHEVKQVEQASVETSTVEIKEAVVESGDTKDNVTASSIKTVENKQDVIGDIFSRIDSFNDYVNKNEPEALGVQEFYNTINKINDLNSKITTAKFNEQTDNVDEWTQQLIEQEQKLKELMNLYGQFIDIGPGSRLNELSSKLEEGNQKIQSFQDLIQATFNLIDKTLSMSTNNTEELAKRNEAAKEAISVIESRKDNVEGSDAYSDTISNLKAKGNELDDRTISEQAAQAGSDILSMIDSSLAPLNDEIANHVQDVIAEPVEQTEIVLNEIEQKFLDLVRKVNALNANIDTADATGRQDRVPKWTLRRNKAEVQLRDYMVENADSISMDAIRQADETMQSTQVAYTQREEEFLNAVKDVNRLNAEVEKARNSNTKKIPELMQRLKKAESKLTEMLNTYGEFVSIEPGSRLDRLLHDLDRSDEKVYGPIDKQFGEIIQKEEAYAHKAQDDFKQNLNVERPETPSAITTSENTTTNNTELNNILGMIAEQQQATETEIAEIVAQKKEPEIESEPEDNRDPAVSDILQLLQSESQKNEAVRSELENKYSPDELAEMAKPRAVPEPQTQVKEPPVSIQPTIKESSVESVEQSPKKIKEIEKLQESSKEFAENIQEANSELEKTAKKVEKVADEEEEAVAKQNPWLKGLADIDAARFSNANDMIRARKNGSAGDTLLTQFAAKQTMYDDLRTDVFKGNGVKDWASNYFPELAKKINTVSDALNAMKGNLTESQIELAKLSANKSMERSIAQAKTTIANIKSQLMDYLEKFPKVEKGLAEPVQKLKAALADPNAYKNAGQLKQAMAELRAQAKSLGLESENLIDKFEKLFGQHLSTMITMAALHKMQDALGVVYQNVVEIDTAITELRKVSEYAGKSLEEYMGRAAEQAQKLGVSISDYINSTADWKRLGYSDEDAENLATYSTLLKNVGDGIDDVNTSSSYLISTLQGFGLLADQAEDVVNKIDAVANTQPVTANDLGEILTRSSAAMSAANNTLEETIALGTAANAVIQDADTVGKVYADAA